MNKKLALYMVQFAGGGVEKLFETLARELSLYFDKVDIVVCNRNNKNFNVEDRKNISIHNLNCTKGYGEIYSVTSFFKLMRYLKKHNPDTLISCPGYSNIIAILAHKLSAVDTKVVTVIDNKISLLKQNKWYHKILFFLFKYLLKYADYVVVPYGKVKEDIINNVSINPNKIHIIPHPVVGSSLFKKAEEPIHNHPFTSVKKTPKLLYVGRLSEEKGLFVLLDAFKKVLKSLDSMLFIIGDGTQRKAIEDWIKTYGFEEKIILLGYQCNPYPYYKQCDLLVLPSKIEAFGLVIVEALALGCPVVSTNTDSGGSDSILANGKYGILCKVNDINSLANAMLSCYSIEWNIDILRQQGLKYSVESSIKQYVKLLLQ